MRLMRFLPTSENTFSARAYYATGKMSAFLLAGAALLTVPQTVHAQGSILPIRVKVGILNATDGDVRNSVGTPLFQGEVDVALPSLSAGKTYISVGYEERSRHGGTFRAIPITVSRV